eukprot:jgi/Chrzof1/12438/Cz06g34200.t1
MGGHAFELLSLTPLQDVGWYHQFVRDMDPRYKLALRLDHIIGFIRRASGKSSTAKLCIVFMVDDISKAEGCLQDSPLPLVSLVTHKTHQMTTTRRIAHIMPGV